MPLTSMPTRPVRKKSLSSPETSAACSTSSAITSSSSIPTITSTVSTHSGALMVDSVLSSLKNWQSFWAARF